MTAANLPTLPRPQRRTGLLVSAGLAALVLALVGALVLGQSADRGRRPRDGSARPAAVPTAIRQTPPAAPPEPARVALEVTSSVPGARVLLDGESLGDVRTVAAAGELPGSLYEHAANPLAWAGQERLRGADQCTPPHVERHAVVEGARSAAARCALERGQQRGDIAM